MVSITCRRVDVIVPLSLCKVPGVEVVIYKTLDQYHIMERLTSCILQFDNVLERINNQDITMKVFVDVKRTGYLLMDYVTRHEEYYFLVPFFKMRMAQLEKYVHISR